MMSGRQVTLNAFKTKELAGECVNELGTAIGNDTTWEAKVRVDVLIVKRRELRTGDGVVARSVDNVFREVIREDANHVVSP